MANDVEPFPDGESDELVRTFEMRLHGAFPALDELAERYQRAKRTVYAKASRTGRAFDTFKAEVCAGFGLPARMFNAICRELGGMVKSAQEKARFDLARTEERLEKLDTQRAKLAARLEQEDLSGKQRQDLLMRFHRKRESHDHHRVRL
ncbi:MAG: hypothetical protein J2P53_18400, partial [Bradyrhizobiaceae bacterium]|nr:hypothetical protein [Bradyrhizobiaceae bacterium]